MGDDYTKEFLDALDNVVSIRKAFLVSDIPEDTYKMNKIIAYGKYKNGTEPEISMSLQGEPTAGYGRQDHWGYWEYPLNVNEDDEILPRK